MHNLTIREAQPDDLTTLVEIINQSYRGGGQRSWASEQGLVQGQRIDFDQLKQLFYKSNVTLLVGEIFTASQHSPVTVACLALSSNKDRVEIGTYCVAPAYQNLGLGRQVLSLAEAYALQKYPNQKIFEMYVLDVRTELIAFYLRAGYIKSGHTEPYPVDADVGVPCVPIELIHLYKSI